MRFILGSKNYSFNFGFMVFLKYSTFLFLNLNFSVSLWPTWSKFDLSDLVNTFTQLLLSFHKENCQKLVEEMRKPRCF